MADETVQQTGAAPDVAGQETEGGDAAGGEQDRAAGRAYSGAEVSQIVRRRLAQEQEKYRLAQAVADSLAALTGRSLEEIYSELQAYQAQAQQAAPAEDQGGEETTVQDAAARNLAVQSALATVHLWRQAELADLRQDPRIQGDQEMQNPETVAALIQAANRMGVGLKQAYWLLHGERRAQELQRETEQRVLENARARAGLMAEGDVVAEAEKLNLTPEEIAVARAQGMDPRDYAALKGAYDLDSFRELKKRAKGG